MNSYFGEICDKHPQLKGERYPSNRSCRLCSNARNAQWKRNNPDKAKNRRYLERYGVTKAEVDKIFAQQNERCACCGTSNSKWHLDHDHATGNIRGLLCRNCNVGLGNFQDSPRFLAAAIKYLQKHKKQSKLKTNKESNE